MPNTRTVLFVALAFVALVGCGTVRNLATGDPEIYGGVQKDIEIIQTPPPRSGVGINPMTLALFTPVDLCLSLVGDTLTLPLAVCMRQNDHSGDDKGGAAGGGNQGAPVGPVTGGDLPGQPRPLAQVQGGSGSQQASALAPQAP
jgi:uncharacterized protein YceK